jgi:hypothetical protein
MNETQQWELSRYGCSVEKIQDMVRNAYVSPREVALSQIEIAACIADSNLAENNRDEIVQALHRAQWILVNKV